jgi:hypothetical protein
MVRPHCHQAEVLEMSKCGAQARDTIIPKFLCGQQGGNLRHVGLSKWSDNYIVFCHDHSLIDRAIVMRYDLSAETFLGMLFVPSAHYWNKFVHAV